MPPLVAAAPNSPLSQGRRRRTPGGPRGAENSDGDSYGDSNGDSDGDNDGDSDGVGDGDSDDKGGWHGRRGNGDGRGGGGGSGPPLPPPTSRRLSQAQSRTLRLLCGCARHWRPRLVSERAPVSDPANRYCCSDACWATSAALGIAGRASVGRCCTKMRVPCPTAVTKLRFDF